jgi:hypothetical protein
VSTNGQLIDAVTQLSALVDNLNTRLLAVEQQPPPVPDESLQPNYLNVSSSGVVSATFSGHVKASGVDLPESTTAPFQATSAVDWLDSGGTVQEFLQGAQNGNLHQLTMETNANTGHGPAQLIVNVDPTGAQGGGSNVVAHAAAAAATVLNENGASSFLQLPAAAKTLLNIGANTITVAANTNYSMAHGLGKTPFLFCAFAVGVSAIQTPISNGAVNMTFQSNVALAAATVEWLVIG